MRGFCYIAMKIDYFQAFQETRSYKQAEQAGMDAGFEVLTSYDLATESSIAGPWWAEVQGLC